MDILKTWIFTDNVISVQGSVPVQRPNPPQTVFNLAPLQSQTGNRFPEPQFGGFRPVKRHLGSDTLSERVSREEREERPRQIEFSNRKFQRNHAPRAQRRTQRAKSANQNYRAQKSVHGNQHMSGYLKNSKKSAITDSIYGLLYDY